MTLRLVLLLVGALVGACRSDHTVRQSTAVTPLLWSIERDGHTSYVFGTMHMGVDPERLPPIVWDKLAAARSFAMETDLSGAARLPVLRTDGTTLRDEIGPDYWRKLEDAVGEAEAARLVGFKPTIPATLVAMRGLPQTPGIDGALLARAQRAGKPIVYLESLEAQFSMLEKWLDARALKDMLDDLPVVAETTAQMLAAYTAGDPVAIEAITKRERERWLARGRTAAEYETQLEDILYRRNASWIPHIERMHREGGGFIAVGAAHTVGARSVIDLLGQRGYVVTRILR